MMVAKPLQRHAAARMAAAWDAQAAHGAFWRLWGVFMNARVAIAAVLLLLQAAMQALGSVPNQWTLTVCIAYLFMTLAVRLWAQPRAPHSLFDQLWVLTIGVDTVAFSLLNLFHASNLNYTPLFVLPVLLASVLGPLLLALGTAALVTLLLLAEASWNSLDGAGGVNASLLQAALTSSGFFLMALLANQLALRLAREEKLLKKSQSAARMQVQVNEMVVATLAEGIVVTNAKGIVRSANPAARQLLGAPEALYPAPFKLSALQAWGPLGEMVAQTFALQSAQEGHVSLVHAGLNTRRLQVRSRLTASRDGLQESLCVMFLQDLREMEARVRIEKLVAMGRMSAAVAHEIRNPLAAISQANALLEEDLQDPGLRRLTGMIAQNSQRLARIVEEVLDIARAQQEIPAPQTTTLQLDEAVGRIAGDWSRQNAACGQLRIRLDASNAAVCFDDDHLRRLMVNLLDNALRYASGSAQAIEVSTQLVAPAQARLAVWSDGQPLEETVQVHLFEPFFSSESRSSGLGLYICRELCERYGALIGYQRVLREDTQGNEFFITFQPASQFLSIELPCLDSVLV